MFERRSHEISTCNEVQLFAKVRRVYKIDSVIVRILTEPIFHLIDNCIDDFVVYLVVIVIHFMNSRTRFNNVLCYFRGARNFEIDTDW